MGFTLTEIEKILDSAAHGTSPCLAGREIVEHRIEENKAKIEELQKLQARLESASVIWQGTSSSTPDGHSICRLIESFTDEDDGNLGDAL